MDRFNMASQVVYTDVPTTRLSLRNLYPVTTKREMASTPFWRLVMQCPSLLDNLKWMGFRDRAFFSVCCLEFRDALIDLTPSVEIYVRMMHDLKLGLSWRIFGGHLEEHFSCNSVCSGQRCYILRYPAFLACDSTRGQGGCRSGAVTPARQMEVQL